MNYFTIQKVLNLVTAFLLKYILQTFEVDPKWFLPQLSCQKFSKYYTKNVKRDF